MAFAVIASTLLSDKNVRTQSYFTQFIKAPNNNEKKYDNLNK